MNPDFPLDLHLYKDIAAISRAVNNKLRQRMLRTIHTKGRLTVTELRIELKIEQSATSTHLKVLREAGFVVAKREGKSVYYSIDYKRINDMQGIFKKLLL